jgi:uncharacterized protein YukE
MSRTLSRPSFTVAALAALAALALLAATGCAGGQKAAVDRQAKAAASIGEIQNEITAAQEVMNAAVLSLEAVYVNDADRARFEQYTRDLAAMKASAARVRSRYDSIRENTEAYFDAWEKELAEASDEIQSIAAERRNDLRAALGRVNAELEATAAAFVPVRTRMEDLSVFLANDLTPKGLVASMELKNTTIADANQVNQRVESLLREVQRLREGFDAG